MSQKVKEAEKALASKLAGVKEELDKLKAKEIKKPTTRVVKLKYKSCCGCGCSDETVKRTVPYDSDLKNGDRIDTMLENDEFV